MNESDETHQWEKKKEKWESQFTWKYAQSTTTITSMATLRLSEHLSHFSSSSYFSSSSKMSAYKVTHMKWLKKGLVMIRKRLLKSSAGPFKEYSFCTLTNSDWLTVNRRRTRALDLLKINYSYFCLLEHKCFSFFSAENEASFVSGCVWLFSCCTGALMRPLRWPIFQFSILLYSNIPIFLSLSFSLYFV